MSSFERRGLPFRDVFDSSFDAIVHVDYLDRKRAHRLLLRRVIGISTPFLDLCHCMAGGLARDLIRTCRSLHELAQRAASRSESELSVVCDTLVKLDIKAKLRAMSIEAREVTLEAEEVDRLFETARELEFLVTSQDNLSKDYDKLLASCETLLTEANHKVSFSPAAWTLADFIDYVRSDEQGQSPPSTSERERVVSLSREIGIYLYYCATVLEFFDKRFSSNTPELDDGLGALDQIARGRQLLATNPTLARSVITRFREAHDMRIPSCMLVRSA